MSEQPVALPDELETYEQVSHAQYLHEALARAEALGFNVSAAVARDYGEAAPESPERTERVVDTAAQLAGELALDKEFFERPANTVLLTAIADVWVENEGRAASTGGYDGRLADERAALVDAAMILAGNTSGFVRELAAQDAGYRERFIAENEQDPDIAARDAYLESLNDPELAAQIEAVFMADGEQSLVAEQRARMGLTLETERPFDIKVLKMSNTYELKQAGVIGEVAWPDWTDEGLTLEEKRAQNEVAQAEQDRQAAFVAPYEAAAATYKERFGDKFGDLPPAFASLHADGSTTLNLQAHDAYAILNYFRDGKPIPEGPFMQSQIEGQYANARHEYGHTQHRLLLGPQAQLGMVLEERKAELVSGDRHGYNDIKDMILDLSNVSNVSILDELDAALKTEDALSAFVATAANKIGLKDTLMLMLAKPRPYDFMPDHARHFVDLKSLKRAGDASLHDAVIRDALERKGDAAIRAAAETWVQRQVDRGANMEFIKEQYFPHRRLHGSTHGTHYLEAAHDRHRSGDHNVAA